MVVHAVEPLLSGWIGTRGAYNLEISRISDKLMYPALIDRKSPT